MVLGAIEDDKVMLLGSETLGNDKDEQLTPNQP